MSPAPSPPWLHAAVDLLGRGGRRGVVRVHGDSMVPTLRDGEQVLVDFAPAPPAVGDVLVFRREDLLVVHRFLGRAAGEGEPYLRFRGDGLPYFDPPIPPSAVVGRAIAARGPGGWRALRGARPRLWARALALHDLFWGSIYARTPTAARRVVVGVDRRLLRAVHAAFSRALHPTLDVAPDLGEPEA